MDYALSQLENFKDVLELKTEGGRESGELDASGGGRGCCNSVYKLIISQVVETCLQPTSWSRV